MTRSVATPVRPRPSRPLPVRVAPAAAPPFESTSAPWAALLAETLAEGSFEWVMGPDGVLLPVALDAGGRTSSPQRRSGMGRRLGRLIGR